MSGIDQTTLQNKINLVSNLGGGTIVLPERGTTTLSSTLIVEENVRLIGNPGFTFNSTSNINMVKLRYQANIVGNGMTIENTNASFSNALLMVEETSALGNFRFRDNTTGASDIILIGHAVEPSTASKGLYLYAEAGTGYTQRSIETCTFMNMSYRNLDYAIYEHAHGATGADLAFCNGNTYDGIIIDDCRHGIYTTTTGSATTGLAVNSNQYRRINVQAGSGMQSAIELTGRSSVFQGYIFDWSTAAGTYSIVSTHGLSNGNIFDFAFLSPSEVNISASDIVPYMLPHIMKEYTVAGVPTASSYDNGVIIVSNETGGRTVATSDGTNWRRVSDGSTIA